MLNLKTALEHPWQTPEPPPPEPSYNLNATWADEVNKYNYTVFQKIEQEDTWEDLWGEEYGRETAAAYDIGEFVGHYTMLTEDRVERIIQVHFIDENRTVDTGLTPVSIVYGVGHRVYTYDNISILRSEFNLYGLMPHGVANDAVT